MIKARDLKKLENSENEFFKPITGEYFHEGTPLRKRKTLKEQFEENVLFTR